MKRIRSYIAILTALTVFAAGGVSPAGAPAPSGTDTELIPEVSEIYGVPLPADEDQTGGYIPTKVNAPAVAEDVSFSGAREALTGGSGEESVDGFDTSSDVPSAFPCSYSNTAELHRYVAQELPPLRNQGSYNICWAHGVMALNEIYMMKKGLSDRFGAVTNTSADYSEVHMAHYCYKTFENEIYGDRGESVYLNSANAFDIGGNTIWSAELLSSRVGAASEKVFPYSLAGTAKNNTDAFLSDKARYEDMVHMENCYVINYADNKKQIKQAVYQNGAATISFRSNLSDAYDSTNNSYYSPTEYKVSHAVVIVGWDDDFPATGFKSTPEGNGAWLIRNSWFDAVKYPDKDPFCGDGYFWLSYYDKTIDKAAYAMDVSPAEADYDNIHRYVNTIYGEASYDAMKSYANAFRVPADKAGGEVLKAVRFQSYDADNNYTIQIYKNLSSDGNPSTGEKVNAATVSGKADFAGIYTVPLSAPVPLSAGERFAVVVTADKRLSLEIAITPANTDKIGSYNTIYPGESYYKVSGGWKDFYEYATGAGASINVGNICIMALTEDVIKTPGIEDISGGSENTSVSINWTGIPAADSYVIKRAQTVVGDAFEEVAILPADRTSFIDTGLLPETTYYYRVIPEVLGQERFEQRSTILPVTTGEEGDMPVVSGNSAYRVNHYKMDKDGAGYTLMQTQTLLAPTGSLITPSTKEYTGFTAPEKQQITVSDNETAQVDYYYTRNRHTVTVNKQTGIESVTGDGEHYYDTEVTIEAVHAKGYLFDGFAGAYTTGSFLMPDRDVVLWAKAVEEKQSSSSSSSSSSGSSSATSPSGHSSSTDRSSSGSSSAGGVTPGSSSSSAGSDTGKTSGSSFAPDGKTTSSSESTSPGKDGSSSSSSSDRKPEGSGSSSSSDRKTGSSSSSSGNTISENVVIDPLSEGKTSYTLKKEVPTEDSEKYELSLELDYCVYDGRKKTPEIQITDPSGGVLIPGRDYKVSYKNNKNANMVFDEASGSFVKGNAAAPAYTVKFKGAYKHLGKVTGQFDIYPYPISFGYLIPAKDVISVRTGRSFRFLKKGTAILGGKLKTINVMRDMDPLRLQMECIEGEHKGEVYTMADNYKAPAGRYVICAYGRGNYYHYKQDGEFELIRK